MRMAGEVVNLPRPASANKRIALVYLYEPDLYMIKICCFLEGIIFPVQILHPSIQLGIIVSNEAAAFEVSGIDGVVANYSSVKSDIRFRECVSDKKVFGFEHAI